MLTFSDHQSRLVSLGLVDRNTDLPDLPFRHLSWRLFPGSGINFSPQGARRQRARAKAYRDSG